jgi:hypothetical protein
MRYRVGLLALILIAGLLASGCETLLPLETPVSTPAPSGSSSTKSGATPAVQQQISAETTVTRVEPAAQDIAYAKSLGGVPHDGEGLFFIVGASLATEREAHLKLEKATSRFGDMQTYFIVQHSDGFDGFEPGWWLLIEAHRQQPSDEDMQLAKRAFPDAYVKPALVRTKNPIPVYEDLVPK